jgi:hypothetical protein
MRALAKRLIAPNTLYGLRVQFNYLRERGLADFLHLNGLLVDAAVREWINRDRYRMLGAADLRAARRSSTVFVFGSGYSLNDITTREWSHIASHDTFGFTAFASQRWVRTDFHLLRGGLEGSLRWRPYAEELGQLLNSNPHFADTIFLMQGEYQAQFANQLLGYGLLRRGARVYRYRTARGEGPPTRTLDEGLRHVGGTLSDAVNAAACLGWKHIVLAGVDLYDSRYFWLGPDETYAIDDRSGLLVPAERNPRGLRYDEVHSTARNGVVEIMGRWRDTLERERGIRLSVFNPRSLLTEVMPVYRLDGLDQASPIATVEPRGGREAGDDA